MLDSVREHLSKTIQKRDKMLNSSTADYVNKGKQVSKERSIQQLEEEKRRGLEFLRTSRNVYENTRRLDGGVLNRKSDAIQKAKALHMLASDADLVESKRFKIAGSSPNKNLNKDEELKEMALKRKYNVMGDLNFFAGGRGSTGILKNLND